MIPHRWDGRRDPTTASLKNFSCRSEVFPVTQLPRVNNARRMLLIDGIEPVIIGGHPNEHLYLRI